MTKESPKLLFRLLNTWFAFVALLLFSSYLPHWGNVSSHLWINEAIYFLLFLLAVSIFLKEKHNKDIFFNLSLFLLVYSFSFLNIFIGNSYLFGSNNTSYYFFHYKKMVFCLLLNMVVIYIVLKYLFVTQKTRVLYAITITIFLPIFIYCFYPYLKNPDFIINMRQKYYIELYKTMFFANVLPFLFILLYGYLLYKKDIVIGEYINLLMSFFFVFIIINMIDNLSRIYQLQIYSIGMYVLTTNLIFLCVILFKKLLFLCSDYGQFYEALIKNKINIGKIRVQRRHNRLNVILIRILKIYLYQRRNYLLTLALLTTLGLIYFQSPKFFAINVAAFLCCFLILFWFINVLYRKRAKGRYTLP